ncbi:sulfatase [Flammeovirga sp. EKP202]|uniref:sulfatase n=1 Tax=Flammeovirga sp. EKP202 TaxID=2770592 RepID=UPI00165F0415|nr:sulfatase [Flammeovirga sp. EKP202]MBD0402011.1 sulfatase [Flammeovirga sp. EKP202]
MKRVTTLLLLFICCSLTIFGADKKPKKPNIILFFVDDMGWKDPSFMGSDYHETPNLDQMAKEGMVFYNAYSSGPNCAPSRASMISGQYTPRHGKIAVWDAKRGPEDKMRLEPVPDRELSLDNYTMAEALKDGGYVTGIFGKWHIAGEASEQGFMVDQSTEPKEIKFKKTNDPKDIYKLTDEACAFMEDNKDNPFFLYLPHHAVHAKWEARQEMIDYFQAKEKGELHNNPAYAAMVKHTDESLGTILKKVKELGIDDNTIIIFTSDNGSLGKIHQDPLRGVKGMLYEGGIRVPMVVWYPPKVKAGSSSTVSVVNTDFYPTFLDMAGLKTPKNKILDGESLKDLFYGKEETLKRSSIFYHYPNYLDGKNQRGGRDSYFRNRPVTVVINGDWKLLFFHEEYILDGGVDRINENNMVELYNIKEDISESNNLALKNNEVRDRLLSDLQQWMDKTNARLAMKPSKENYRPPFQRGKKKNH